MKVSLTKKNRNTLNLVKSKVVFVMVIVLILLSCLNACKNVPHIPTINDATFKNWQSNRLSKDVLLTEMIIPGSHDAGSVGMMGFTETQGSNIYYQLLSGIRYLDIRVNKKDDDLLIFHSMSNGIKFEEVCKDIAKFISEQSTEFLVLDFQHFKNQSMNDVHEMIIKYLNPEKFALKTTENLNELTYGVAKANGYKYAIIWGSNDIIEGQNYLHKRENSLISPYIGKNHFNGWAKLFDDVFNEYYEKQESSKFFVLQSVQTIAFNPFKKTFLKTPKSFSKKLYKIQDDFFNAINLNKTNIIMIDYCTDNLDFNEKIIALNDKKFM